MFFFDNRSATGMDRISDFDPDDFLVTTVPLVDPEADGIIAYGPGKKLDLGQGSSARITSAGMRVEALESDGGVVVGGAEYFVYSLLGTSAVLNPETII